MHNSIFLRALQKNKLDTPPIWLMRQAGRYLPEYQIIRRKFKDFLDMCKRPEICAELVMQPIQRYNLDAAILFSDILTIPDAFDLGLKFYEGEGPIFERPINTVNDISSLCEFDESKLNYVYKAVEITKENLSSTIPLIGFCGSPWTLVAYSIEGGSSKDFKKTKDFISMHPSAVKQLLEKVTSACFLYLKEQVKSGIDAIQIFDSWADLLDVNQFSEFSLNFTKDLVQMLKNDDVTNHVPIILFEKAPPIEVVDIAFDGLACMSLHHSNCLEGAKSKLQNKYAIQGNLDPKVLTLSEKEITQQTEMLLDTMRDYPGFIFNLGHGITPNINPDKIQVMIDTIRNS
tara:strand:- start:60 stop:1094 length:1035 start_codon:yes stop_codon:yes gene_type:complete